MPVVQISMVEGRSSEAIENCMKNVAKAVSESLNAPVDSVRVIINEIPKNRFSVGTTLKSEE